MIENALNRICDGFFFLFKYLLIFFMVEITIVITVSIFCRYSLNAPLCWAEEVTRYSFVWATFIGAAAAYRRRELVCMSVISNALSPHVRWVVMLMMEIVMAGFLLICAIFGTKMTLVVAPQQAVATQISMAWLYMVVPLSTAFMFLCSITNIWTMVLGREALPTWGEDWS